jgi:hypothetical protein
MARLSLRKKKAERKVNYFSSCFSVSSHGILMKINLLEVTESIWSMLMAFLLKLGRFDEILPLSRLLIFRGRKFITGLLLSYAA